MDHEGNKLKGNSRDESSTLVLKYIYMTTEEI